MSTDPCASDSNDNLDLVKTNDSNDGLMWNLAKRANGCGDVAAEAAMDPEPDEAEPEEQEEPDPEPVVTELPKFLSCASATAKGLDDAEGIKSIDLEYDYEIRTTEGADLFALVNKYELDLLKAVADQFSLTSCEIVRRSLRKERRKLAGDSSVVAVGSEPEDTEDSVHTECIMDTENCTPMNGAMTAWVYESDERRLSESNIYAIIEGYTNSYKTTDGVLGMSYIGTRPDVSEAAAPFIEKATKDDERDHGQHDDLATSSGAMGPGAIAGIAVASIVALIAILALVAKKSRDRKNAKVNARSARSIVDAAMFMSDDDDELKEVNDDASKSSADTEDHTYDGTLPSSATFESEGEPDDEAGFEVKL